LPKTLGNRLTNQRARPLVGNFVFTLKRCIDVQAFLCAIPLTWGVDFMEQPNRWHWWQLKGAANREHPIREKIGWYFVSLSGFGLLGFVDDYGNLYCPKFPPGRIIAPIRMKVETM